MTLEEYRATVEYLGSALRSASFVVGALDLDGVGAQLERADSLGPMFDPTAWIRANANGQLELQRGLLEWARTTKTAGERLTRLAGELQKRQTGQAGKDANLCE